MSDNTENNKSDWSKRELGALWKNQGRSQTYLTGHISTEPGGDPQKVIVFSNKNKTKTNQPDFRVYRSETKQEETPSNNETDEFSLEETSEELLEEV